MSKHHHKVKTHHWHDGVLHTVEHVFESLEEALGFAGSADGHSVKVYNADDQLVHQTNNQSNSTYA
jgi:hypothetical protein